jgi:hypothetical protein
VWLLAQGRTATGLAQMTSYSAYWTGQIAKRYNAEGPDGLRNRRYTTSHRTPPVISARAAGGAARGARGGGGT